MTVQLIVVDAANVVGSRPDGWWRDRAGAARRLLAKLTTLAEQLEDPAEVIVVLEGAAKAAAPSAAKAADTATGAADAADTADTEFDGLGLVLAAGSGDDAIVAVVADAAARESSRVITVVTADRGLRERVEALGAVTVGPSWVLDRVEP